MRWHLSDLSVRYFLDESRTIDALSGVSLTIEKGERLAVVGANGSGKSTLARCLTGILQPTHGRIAIERDPTRLESDPADADSMAALVFQAPEDNLIAETVRQEIMLTLEHTNSGEANPDRAEKCLAAFGLGHLIDRPIQCLSGGEKQKLAIACALASGRDLIVLDEPTSHLDPPGRRDLLAHILGSSWRDKSAAGGNPAVVLITQYLEDARRFPRVIVLHQGAVVYDGTADGWQGLPSSSAHGNFRPQPSIPNAPVIVTTHHLSQLAQPNWPLPSSPLSDVTIQMRAGDAIGLCGPIGSGKSTLGYHLAGLFDSYAGTRDLAWAGQPQRSPVVMIQFPERQLFCATVGDDVAFGPSARGNERQQATELATTALEMMGLPPAEFTERSPFELSAGQQRRAGMAGVAACSAPFYVLDEPTAALDADGLARLESLLAQWQCERVAYLIISHDLDWLAQVTHRVWVMDAGRILFDGLWSDSVQLDPVLTNIGFRDSR